MGGHVLATCLRGSHPVSRIPQGGALRLSSKRSSRKRGRRARSRRSGERSEAERLPYAGSGTQMGNKVRTKNVRIYGEHGVCNTLCLFMYPLLRRSYRICFSFYSRQKPLAKRNNRQSVAAENPPRRGVRRLSAFSKKN